MGLGRRRTVADTLFGLHAAAAIRPGAFDVLDYAVRTAPDLRTALQRLARYNRLVHDLASFEVITAGDAVRVEHHFEGQGARPCRHAAEFTLASLVVVASQRVASQCGPWRSSLRMAPGSMPRPTGRSSA